MNLIDKDALETAIDKEREILIEQGRPGAEHIVVHHARRLIEEAPTIDAIPVEWIIEQHRKLHESGASLETCGALSAMLAKWFEEQEAR